MNKVMTAEQAFNVAMNEYPELYAGDSLHSAKMKYYDHVFNVIGNGYRTYDFFVTNNTINSDNFEFTKSFPLKYIQGKSLFRAFTRIDKTTNYEITYKLPELYTKEELDLRTDVIHVQQAQNYPPVGLYPNFKPEYSNVLGYIFQLDKSWVDVAIYFYKTCKEYFSGDMRDSYTYACPKDTDDQQWDKILPGYEESLRRYRNEGMSDAEFYPQISRLYGVDYRGDLKDFIIRKWEQELARINKFIDDTIFMLENHEYVDPKSP